MGYETDERKAIQQEGSKRPIKVVEVYPVVSDEDEKKEKDSERNNQRRTGSASDRR